MSTWASDVPAGRERRATIDYVESEEVGESKKLVAYFQEPGLKKMTLNKTNWRAIAAAHGEDDDDWCGKTIMIRQDVCQYKSQSVPCLRVRPVIEDGPVQPVPGKDGDVDLDGVNSELNRDANEAQDELPI